MTQTEVAVLTQKIEYLREKLESLHGMVEKHIEQEENQWEKVNKQIERDYARKWVEVVVGFVIFAVSTSVVGWVISQQATINDHMIQTKSTKLTEK